MPKSNVVIVKEYIETIINQRQFDRLPDFCTPDCVSHAAPYVGLGLTAEDTDGEHVILRSIVPNGPAHGHLHVGDELIRVKDGERTWEDFDELRKGLWGMGVVGTELIITVLRHGNLVTIPIERGRVDNFDINLSEFFNTNNPYWTRDWPDLHMEIQQIFESGDKVICYAINSGTHMEYDRSAIWGEIDIFKLMDDKITDIWAVEDSFSELKQLGYQILEPVRETA